VGGKGTRGGRGRRKDEEEKWRRKEEGCV